MRRFCGAGRSLQCGPLREAAAMVTAGDVVVPWLKPHILGGRDLSSLGQDPRDSVSMCGWELPVGTSGLPGRGGESGARGVAPPRVQKGVSERR